MNQSREGWRPGRWCLSDSWGLPSPAKIAHSSERSRTHCTVEGVGRPVQNAKSLGVLLWGTRGSCRLEGLMAWQPGSGGWGPEHGQDAAGRECFRECEALPEGSEKTYLNCGVWQGPSFA